MRNLGKATAQMLAEVDILTEEDLRNIGAVEAFAHLKFRFGSNVTFVALYALHSALVDRDWRDITPEEKNQLKASYRARGDANR